LLDSLVSSEIKSPPKEETINPVITTKPIMDINDAIPLYTLNFLFRKDTTGSTITEIIHPKIKGSKNIKDLDKIK
jgi:hypothetical protein